MPGKNAFNIARWVHIGMGIRRMTVVIEHRPKKIGVVHDHSTSSIYNNNR